MEIAILSKLQKAEIGTKDSTKPSSKSRGLPIERQASFF